MELYQTDDCTGVAYVDGLTEKLDESESETVDILVNDWPDNVRSVKLPKDSNIMGIDLPIRSFYLKYSDEPVCIQMIINQEFSPLFAGYQIVYSY